MLYNTAEKKYLHIALKENVKQILDLWYLDNTNNKSRNIYWNLGKKTAEVKRFVYDLLKIQESKYNRNAPRVDDQFIINKKIWGFLNFFPKDVCVYKVELFNALIFETDIAQKFIIENYAYDTNKNNKQIYYETAFLKRAKIIKPQLISWEEAANILWLKEPFITTLSSIIIVLLCKRAWFPSVITWTPLLNRSL